MGSGQYPLLDSKNLIGIFANSYEEALNGVWATEIGTVMPSDMETETYGWLGAAPNLEELVEDNAKEEQLPTFIYALRNIDYAKALKYKENDLRRDKIGQLRLRVEDMAMKAAEFWNPLAAKTILTNPVGYDKVKFFSTTHPEAVGAGGPIQANDLDATQTGMGSLNVVDPTAPTPLEAATALNAVLGQFYLVVDSSNYPANGSAREFVVLVATAPMWAAMSAAANLFTFAQGAQNPIAGLEVANGIKVKVILVPQLNVPAAAGMGTDNDWTQRFAVFRTDAKVKSLLLQDEVPVTPAVSTKQNDEYIKKHRFIFSIFATRATGVMRWNTAFRAKLS